MRPRISTEHGAGCPVAIVSSTDCFTPGTRQRDGTGAGATKRECVHVVRAAGTKITCASGNRSHSGRARAVTAHARARSPMRSTSSGCVIVENVMFLLRGSPARERSARRAATCDKRERRVSPSLPTRPRTPQLRSARTPAGCGPAVSSQTPTHTQSRCLRARMRDDKAHAHAHAAMRSAIQLAWPTAPSSSRGKRQRAPLRGTRRRAPRGAHAPFPIRKISSLESSSCNARGGVSGAAGVCAVKQACRRRNTRDAAAPW